MGGEKLETTWAHEPDLLQQEELQTPPLAGKPPAGDDAGMDEQLLAEQLRDLGVHGVLVQMVESGLIAELRCAMPECYSSDGREAFDLKTHPPGPWAPSVDHYPILKRDGGHLVPDNVRLSHILCNNLDYALNVLPEEKREAVVMRWRKKYTEGSFTNARARGPGPAQRTEGHVEAAQVDEETSLLKRQAASAGVSLTLLAETATA